MSKDSGDKTRRQRRKEARLEKNKKKFDSWVQHHKIKKTINNNQKVENMQKDTQIAVEKELMVKVSKKREPMRKRKTEFEKYLEMENESGVASAKEDLELERKLAKKLKVEKGKLGGGDDGLNMLFEENIDTEEASRTNIPSKKHNKNSKKKMDLVETDHEHNHAKYVPPQLRSMCRSDSEAYSQIRKRVRGLLNRLGESNVERITGEVSSIFQSISRSDGTKITGEEILASCAGGPRGNEQYAAVFAALVSGLTCLVGIDFGAKLLASLAMCFEDEYKKEDNLSLRNLTLLLSYLYIFGVCSSDLIYDFMMMLSSRLTEVDVSTILTILNCSGMRLRSDDPITMKNFIGSIQNKVTELKAGSEGNTRSKRMEFMLETISAIKNNKKMAKEDTLQHTRINKWLQKLRVESILIRGLKWSKLLDPEKKGQWWLSEETISSTANNNNNNIENVTKNINKESFETRKMRQLAAGQGMNTDTRRAIFYIIINGDDYIDAFEKLLRLDLQGKQDREIMRVVLGCGLQEEVFNKYYCVLASKLCDHDKNHKFTLQYCIWDQYAELESMKQMRSTHLAKFVAEMVSSFTLSLAVLKKADLHDTTRLGTRKLEHFKKFFETVFGYADNLVWNVFKRVSGSPQYETLRTGILFFIERYVIGNEKQFVGKYKIAKKALLSVEEDEDPFL